MNGSALVIDDNPLDLKVASSIIERSGYACFAFTDYKAGLEWCKENTPQIIFLDLQMPNITGYELIPILKAQPNTSKTPLFIISGKNQIEDVLPYLLAHYGLSLF